MRKDLSFEFEGQSHEAMILSANGDKPNFVFLHGAGLGSKERILVLADYLTPSGICIFAFDHSGAGRDAEHLKQSSLKRRTDEAKYAIEHYLDLANLTVCASSMGGHVAIRMLEYFPVKTLILFGPAIYDREVFELPFGEAFSEGIRKPDSWKNSEVLELIKRFKGRLLVVIGTEDEIIPPEVIRQISESAKDAAKQEIVRIPDADHQIMKFLEAHPQTAMQIANKIIEFAS